MQVVCDDMVVVRDLTELPPSEPQQANLFVLSEDPLLLHLLITTASSFSISLGEAARPRTCSKPTYPPSTSRVSSLPLNLTRNNPCAFPVVTSRRPEHVGRGGASAEQAPSRASRRQAAQPLRRRERPQRTCVVSPHGMLLHMLGAAIGRGTERGPGMLLFVVQMVTELAKQLEGRVDVIHCMVDRICVDRSIEPRAIGVKCEPYEGEMVIMRRASNGLPPPFEGQFIRSPAMDAQVRRTRSTGQTDAAVEGTCLTCQCCCCRPSSACLPHRRPFPTGAVLLPAQVPDGERHAHHFGLHDPRAAQWARGTQGRAHRRLPAHRLGPAERRPQVLPGDLGMGKRHSTLALDGQAAEPALTVGGWVDGAAGRGSPADHPVGARAAGAQARARRLGRGRALRRAAALRQGDAQGPPPSLPPPTPLSSPLVADHRCG